jgi:type II secretory pathway component PulF
VIARRRVLTTHLDVMSQELPYMTWSFLRCSSILECYLLILVILLGSLLLALLLSGRCAIVARLQLPLLEELL